MSKAYIIIDMQYGSTGKGSLAGFLAKKEEPDVCVTAWGPNAGHTYIDENGRKFIHRMLANGVVSPRLETVLIGPGSVVDLDILREEILRCKDLLEHKEIVIHPQAVIVTKVHAEIEKRNVTIGSTMKGTGAAIIQRIERDPKNLNTAHSLISEAWCLAFEEYNIKVYVDDIYYKCALSEASVLQIEGAQGFSLSMYHGQYPYTTSRDVTTAQVLADCAVPWNIKPLVYGTLRTYPIRVSDRYENGVKVGTSGPCYSDQYELSWEDLGLEPELTTVTKLPRRLFNFSYKQLKEASYQCGPDVFFLNFVNYMEKDVALHLIENIQRMTGVTVAYVGVGPNHQDVITTDEYSKEEQTV